MWQWLFGNNPERSANDGIWCVVANIKREHPFGPGGRETKIGTRQFRSGAKVYIAGCYPGTCDGLVCIGLHRKARRFITSVVHVKYVENFRVKMVYQPKVIERIRNDRRCWIKTKEQAEDWAAAFPRWQELWEKKS